MAGPSRHRRRQAPGYGHGSPRARHLVLWLVWKTLRIIRNSTGKGAFPAGGKGMANIVLAHGAWSAAWAWKKMRPLLRDAGHQFFSPTYTGLGARAHLATPSVDLSTHVQDIVSEIEFEDLKDVVLLGHSYGGMVATGVADKIGSRLARIVYIDAFAPKDGQSLFDLTGPKAEGNMRKGAEKDGDGWKLPIN